MPIFKRRPRKPTPEALQRQTELYRQSVDREAVREILSSEEVPGEVVTRWRESAGFAKMDVARLLGVSFQTVQRAEEDEWTDSLKGLNSRRRMAANLKALVQDLETHGFEFDIRDRSESRTVAPVGQKYVAVTDVVASQGVWRRCENPECRKLKYFTNNNQLYCSKRCADIASLLEIKSIGRSSKVRREKSERKPVIVKCPGCGLEHPLRGTVVGHHTIDKAAERDRLRQGAGQADHDSQGESGSAAGPLLGLVRPGESGLQPYHPIQEL